MPNTGQTQTQATDLDIAAWHVWIDNEPDDAVGTHCTAGEIRKLLNRIAASESRAEKAETRRDNYEASIDEALSKIGIPDQDTPQLVLDVWQILYRERNPGDHHNNATVAKVKEAIGE